MVAPRERRLPSRALDDVDAPFVGLREELLVHVLADDPDAHTVDFRFGREAFAE